ncbi:UNVERIFIED_CONTAM: 5'-adenylylsulfate reductase-like 5 [Sesamum latifolium]|uniref:5'-adenylylsulfate reductase-like 5 n=1 Tax=Sesamum latifolium TaxID=2727402 RepID=A0AAW2Y4L6_9LAMI
MPPGVLSQASFSQSFLLSVPCIRRSNILWSSNLQPCPVAVNLPHALMLTHCYTNFSSVLVPATSMLFMNIWKSKIGKTFSSCLNNFILGLYPVVDIVEETSSNSESGPKVSQLWNAASLKETFLMEPYLVLSAVFVFLRAFLYFFPEIVSRIMALWVAHIPHLNLGIFGESRQLLAHVLHLIDVKRIWSKLKLCKTRNFHERARNARVWASSLASVSLGETSSTRIFPSRDL